MTPWGPVSLPYYLLEKGGKSHCSGQGKCQMVEGDKVPARTVPTQYSKDREFLF